MKSPATKIINANTTDELAAAEKALAKANAEVAAAEKALAAAQTEEEITIAEEALTAAFLAEELAEDEVEEIYWREEDAPIKLLLTKTIYKACNAFALANQFHCEIEVQEDDLIITKNPQLTDNEFSVMAGKLVMEGFNVELI